jgi:hypothetical protein
MQYRSDESLYSISSSVLMTEPFLCSLKEKYTSWASHYLRHESGLCDPSNPQATCIYVACNLYGDDGDFVTTSEAHGYGMLAVAMYGSRETFEGLLRYADHFRNHNGLLGQRQYRDPRTGRLVPSPDDGEWSMTSADLDCAAALWIAAQRWSEESFAARARTWCDAILEHCVHPERHTLLVGDWAHPNAVAVADHLASHPGKHSDSVQDTQRWRSKFRKIHPFLASISPAKRASKQPSSIRRVVHRMQKLFRYSQPKISGNTTLRLAQKQHTVDPSLIMRTSDCCLAHLVLFSSRHVERAMQWMRVFSSSLKHLLMQYHQSPDNGLVADFLVWDQDLGKYMPASGKVLESHHDGHFYWNACRVPWRIAQYYCYTRDPMVEGYLRAFVCFLETKCKDGIVYAGYSLSGKPLVNYTDLAFLATAAFCLWVMDSPLFERVCLRMNEEYPSATYLGETIALLTLIQSAYAIRHTSNSL